MNNLGDVPVKVKVVVGSKVLTVDELQSLKNNEVIQLDQMAGSLADVYVNDKLLAKAEIVLVGDFLGVKIKELISK